MSSLSFSLKRSSEVKENHKLDLVHAMRVHLELDIRSVIVWPAVIGPRSSNEPRGDWYRKLTRGLQEISIT